MERKKIVEESEQDNKIEKTELKARNIFIFGILVAIFGSVIGNFLWDFDPSQLKVWRILLAFVAMALLFYVFNGFKKAQEESRKKIGKNTYLISHIKETADYRAFKRKRAAKK